MFCTRCGTKLGEGDSFCTKCGFKIPIPSAVEEAEIEDAGEGSPEEEVGQDAATEPISASVITEPEPLEPAKGEPSEPSAFVPAAAAASMQGETAVRSKVPIIAAAVAVAAVVVAAVAFFVFSSMPKAQVIDEASFPDAGVRAALAVADTDGDGALSSDEAEAIESLEVESGDLSALSEALPNLKEITVSGNASGAVDATSASSIQKLTVTSDSVTEVKAPGSGSLQSVEVSGSSVEKVDVSGSDSLESLVVEGSSVGEVNASGSGSLQSVTVAGDSVDRVDVSDAGSLESVVVEGGSPSVDVSGAGSLVNLVVPEGSQVSGLESSRLREVWLPASVSQGDQSGDFWRCEIERDSDGRMSAIHEGSVLNSVWSNAQWVRNTTFVYDDEGRLSSTEVWRGDPEGEPSEILENTFTYDEEGRVASKKDDAEIFKCAYDANGRLTAGPIGGYSATYAYDNAGNLASASMGNGASFQWGYDAEGRVSSYVLPYGTGGGSTYGGSVSYDDEGRAASIGRVSGDTPYAIEATYLYDDEGRLSGAQGEQRVLDGPETSALISEVSYDEHGNAVTIRNELASPGGQTQVETYEIEYVRFFAPLDSDLQSDVVVAPSMGAGGDSTLIQAYMVRPDIVRADPDMPLALDPELFQSNTHLSL